MPGRRPHRGDFPALCGSASRPKGELEYLNPFTLLVAVVLSAQATDAGVNKATGALFAIADTPQKMLALGEERLREMIKTIGLYRTKAKHVILLSESSSRSSAARFRMSARPRIAARRRPQDRQCGDEHRLRRADDRGRHAYFPGLEPHPAGAGKTPLEVERGLEAIVPRILQDPRASLADFAWALCVQGAPARVRALPDRGPLHLSGKARVRSRPGLVRLKGQTGQKRGCFT